MPRESKPATFTSDNERWNAVVGRDAAADGVFWYGVKSTRIYCRPSCAAKRPLRRNVSFHATCADAEGAGFKPCKRCQPSGPSVPELQAQAVTKACKMLAASEDSLNLETLAAAVGMSPFHFHRVFKKVTGLTPRAFAASARSETFRTRAVGNRNVTEAIFDSGYGSSSSFYKQSTKTLGMKPKSYQDGGKNEVIEFALGKCSLGSVLVASTNKGICAIALGDSTPSLEAELRGNFPQAQIMRAEPAFAQTVNTVISMMETPGVGLHLPLDLRGTLFQKRVWQALTEIPAGSTLSYSEVAGQVGKPAAVRAVASACAANKIAVAIPCHRVVRSDGSVSGYRWGVDRKRSLLDREASQRRNKD